MRINRICLKNFKNFTQKDENMAKMTFIRGKNGSGKSTLALESILFCFYGYTPLQTLKDVPTRNMAKTCTVEIEVEFKDKTYRIVRHYPTKLIVFENNKKLTFVNSSEAQDFINKNFGDRLSFQKFRILDAYTKETNFLDEGQTTIKKIIFASSETFFNNLRIKLQQLKKTREIFNKDKAVIYKHYPSDKRLNILTNKIIEFQAQEYTLRKSILGFERELNNTSREIGRLEENKKSKKNQENKLANKQVCYACKQLISTEMQKALLTEIQAQIKRIDKSLEERLQDQKNITEILIAEKRVKDNISVHITILRNLQMKLQGRIKQKDYKYTDKDVLIVKTALEEVDRLSTYYLTESIEILEPIINEVLSKIGFQAYFTVNEKEKFTITLQKEGIDYNYKDLSTGQKLILQLAFKLALLMERGEDGVIIADEGMASLDKENLEHVLGLFQNMPFQLIFVLHNLEEVPDHIKTINLN